MGQIICCIQSLLSFTLLFTKSLLSCSTSEFIFMPLAQHWTHYSFCLEGYSPATVQLNEAWNILFSSSSTYSSKPLFLSYLHILRFERNDKLIFWSQPDMLYWADFCVISDNCMLPSSSKSTFKIESSFTGLMDITGTVSARLMGQTHKYINTDTQRTQEVRGHKKQMIVSFCSSLTREIPQILCHHCHLIMYDSKKTRCLKKQDMPATRLKRAPMFIN